MSRDREGAREADPFSVLTVAALIGVGVTAFCAFLALAAYAPTTHRQDGGNALSESAVGFAGIVELLRGLDRSVSISRSDPAQQGDVLLVLTPAIGLGKVPYGLVFRASSATLIVLPKWSVGPDREHPGWVEREGLLDRSLVAAALPVPISLDRRSGETTLALTAADGPFAGTAGLAAGPIRDLQLIDRSSPDWAPALQTTDGGTILAHFMQGRGHSVYVLSDPDLIDTQGLKSIETTRAAVALLDRLRKDAPVIFDVSLSGIARTPSLLRLLFEPPLLGATVCAAGAALLILALAVRRFGPAVEPPRLLDFGKRALADNAAGLIALAGREPGMVAPYADLIQARGLREIGAPPQVGPADAHRLLAAAEQARGLPIRFGELAREAREVRTRPEAMAVAGRLFEWGRGLRRGHR